MEAQELITQIVCNNVRVDKNIIPAYLEQLFTGKNNFTIISAYYDGQGQTCQSGQCGKHIHNVYVVLDKTSNVQYRVGSECAKKYGGLDQLTVYWTKGLERAKRIAMWNAKRAVWAAERDEKKRQSIEAHTKELEFIEKYTNIKASLFLESIQNVIENGWTMSEKQREVLDKIMRETDFVALEGQSKKDEERFQEVLQMFETLDHIKWGAYPGADVYGSMRSQFAKNGALSDKQAAFLRGMQVRFRKQVAKL
jgi:hypothetical protein